MSGLDQISFINPNAMGNMQEMRERMMAMADADQNGSLSFDEIASTERGAQMVDKLRAFDTDGSGDLSTDEMAQIQEQVASKIREKMQTMAFPGSDPQALIEALYAEEDI